MKKYASYACILAAAACWGCIGLFNRPLLNAGIAPENLVVVRNLGGLAVMALFFLCTDRSVFKMKAKHLPIFIATGIISVVLFTLCYFNAQKLCSLSVSAILLYTAPAMVVLMSALVFKEKITGKKLLALALALLGCALVTGVFTGELSLTTKGLLYGLGAAFLSIADHVSLENALYETISALCTVGLTTGITSSLGTASQIILIVLMFFGRLGIMTISVGFMAANRAEERVSYAETKIMIG